MAEDTIVTTWDLDASGYLQELQQVNSALALVAGNTAAVKAATEALVNGINTANVQLNTANTHLSNVSKSTDTLAKNNKGLFRTFSDLKAGVSAVAGILGAAASGMDRFIERGAQYSSLMASLPFSIEQAQTASKGLIDVFALMEAANRSSAMGLGLNSQQFAVLSDQVAVLSSKLGKDANEALTGLIESLGKGNTRGLESIGVVVDQQAAFEEYAKSANVAVGELTELQKQQATLQASLKALSEATTGQTSDVSKLGDSWQALKNSASESVDVLTSAVAQSKALASVTNAINSGLRSIISFTKENWETFDPAIARLRELFDPSFAAVNKLKESIAASERARRVALEDAQFGRARSLAENLQRVMDTANMPEAPSKAELSKQASEQASARAEAYKKAQQEQEAQLKSGFDRLIYNAQNKIGSLFLTDLQRSFVDQIAKLPADMQAKALQFLEAESPKVAENIRKAIETINAAAQDEERKEAARNLFAYQANIEHGLEEARKKRNDFLNEMAFAIADISNQSYIGSALGQQYKDKNGDVSRSKLGAMGYGEDQESGRRVVDALQMQSDELNRIVQQNEGLDYFTRMFPPDVALAIIENIHEMDASMQHMAAGPMAAFGQAAEVGFSSFADGLQQALSGQKSFADALKQGLGAFLTTFSKRMTLLGLEESALALASFATGDYPGGGIHIAAAGAFFAAAAATGIAGASLSAGASQRQSRAAWRPGTERGTGGASSATGARAQNSVNVTYNINSILPPDQQQVDAWFKGALRRANAGA